MSRLLCKSRPIFSDARQPSHVNFLVSVSPYPGKLTTELTQHYMENLSFRFVVKSGEATRFHCSTTQAIVTFVTFLFYLRNRKEYRKLIFPQIITASKRSLWQGNVFTLVCHFVHKGETVLPDRDPPGQRPPGQRPPYGKERPIRILLESILVYYYELDYAWKFYKLVWQNYKTFHGLFLKVQEGSL